MVIPIISRLGYLIVCFFIYYFFKTINLFYFKYSVQSFCSHLKKIHRVGHFRMLRHLKDSKEVFVKSSYTHVCFFLPRGHRQHWRKVWLPQSSLKFPSFTHLCMIEAPNLLQSNIRAHRHVEDLTLIPALGGRTSPQSFSIVFFFFF